MAEPKSAVLPLHQGVEVLSHFGFLGGKAICVKTTILFC